MTKIIQWVIKMASEAPKTTLSLVGQGSILDKTPLHLVGYLGKNPESSVPPPDGWCPVCKAKGQSQALRAYRINFTQSLLLCTNPQCIYPLGYTPLDNIITTTEDLKKPCHPSKQKKRFLETSPPSIGCVKKRRIDGSDCKTFIPESTPLCPVNTNCNSSPNSMTQECGETIQSQTFLSSSNNVSRLAEENLSGGSAAGYSSNGTPSLVHDMPVPPTLGAPQWEPSGSPKGLCSDMQCENDGEIHDLNSDTNSRLCGGAVEISECDNSVHGNMLNGAQHEESMGQNSDYVSASFIHGSSVVAENGQTETNLEANVCESSVQSPKPQDFATDDCVQESLTASYLDFSHFVSALDVETLNTTFSSLSVSELINDTSLDVHSFGETSSSPKVTFQGTESIKGSPVAVFNVSIDAVVHLSEKINVSDTSLTDSELSEPDCITKGECSPPTATASSSDLQGLHCDLQDRSSLNVFREADVVKHKENDNSTANLPTSEKSHLVQDGPNDAELTVFPSVLPELQVEGQSSPEVCTSVLGDNSSVEHSCSTSQITSLSGDTSQGSISRQDVAEAMESPSKNHYKTHNPIDVQQPESSLPAPTVEQDCGNTSLNLPAENQSSSDNAPDMPRPVANQAAEKSNGRNKVCKYLQWRNKHSLCWLDCIMVFLVHSGTLKNFMSKGDPIKESVIHTLFEKYNEASTKVTSGYKTRLGHQRKLTLAQKCLEDVRMVLFDKVKDRLKCNLGDQESPVFAFSLLLHQEPVFEELFLHSFSWSFSCKLCGYESRERCQKTITTFTKIVPDWNPLNAVHTAPCNKCQDPGQKRKMNLERVRSIFMLHFVEGLPSSDLQAYSFQFEENFYEVRGVIQYSGNHFSAWMASDDGTWLESDDLKGSYCRQHKGFAVSSNEMHIVIWERSTLKVPEKQRHPSVEGNNPETPLDQSASSGRVQSSSSELLETTAESPTPNKPDFLFGFEGYADDDVITLTLTEIQVDAFGNPIENCFNPVDSFSDPAETSVDMVEKGLAQDVSNCLDSVADDTQSQEPTTLPSVLPSPSFPDTVGCEAPTMCTLVPLHIDRPQTSVSTGSKTVYALQEEGGARPNQSPSCKPESVMGAPVSHEAYVKAANLFKEKCEPFSPPGKKGRAKHSTSPSPEGAKKGVVGSWMKSLLCKNPSLATLYNASKNPTTLHTTSLSPLKVTDSHPFKKAQSFGGFKARSTPLPARNANEPSSGSHTPKGQACPSTQTFHTPVVPSLLTRGRNGTSNGRLSVSDHSSSSDDKIRRLRLKLLKRLKAKKNELATLEALAKTQHNNCDGNQISSLPEVNTFNRREHLRGFLQELQDHIDNADNESMCTMSSSASICSSPDDADFFAELFSPSAATTVAAATTTDENSDSNLLEMWMDGLDTSLPREQTNHHPPDYPQLTNGDHFTTCRLPSPQKTPVGSTVTNGSFDSSAMDQNFDLLSASTLEMMPEETSFMSSFDIF